MENIFFTIKTDTNHELVIKKSRFICHLKKIASEEEAREFISSIGQAHRKANHNCFAYLIGDHDEIQRESDNGEPSGTAGVPILEALQKRGLHNVCAVVTRYFGGIKLGAGGLIRAYSNVTSTAIEEAGIVQRITQTILAIEVPYKLHDQLLYHLQQIPLEIADEVYGVNVTVTTQVYVDNDQIQTVIDDLTSRFNDQLTLTPGEERQHEIPYNK